ncbi:MAG: low molecular weight protein-tyrosine-phosphatase [Rhodospirillales bacterium]
MVSVLFVCLGNICRSPTAHGMFEALAAREGLSGKITVDSCGTGDWHTGAPPDERAQAAVKKRGVDISGLAARRVNKDDFERFDYIIAMDRANLANLRRICPSDKRDRLHLFMAFAPDADEDEIPDPYYGGTGGFDVVLNMIESAGAGLLADIRTRLAGP